MSITTPASLHVELRPKRPPGRADRKAAAYAAEIVRLRGAGYTYEAIREAMAEVGIELSTSALRREVRRLRGRCKPAPFDSPSTHRLAATNRAITPSTPAPDLPPQADSPAPIRGSRGHDIAEAFFKSHPSNPLVQTEETP